MGNGQSQTDAGFGPQRAGHYDFTLLFEHSIFTTLPSAVIVVFTLIHIWSIYGSTQRVRPGALFWVKAGLGVTLFAINAAVLLLWIFLSGAFWTKMSLAAVVLSTAGSFCVLTLLVLEHFYSFQTSTFISLFVTVTALLDAAKTYSCFNRTGLDAICGLYIATAAVKVFILVSEEVSKRHLIYPNQLSPNVSREVVSGFWTRSLFLWLNPMLLMGFRSTISIDDLPDMGPELDSALLFDAFTLRWNQGTKSSRFALAKACFLTFYVDFTTIVIPRLCNIGFIFSQPFLLHSIVQAVGERGISAGVDNGLIGAVALVYLGIFISGAYHTYLSKRVTVSLRGALSAAVFDKMLRLTHDELQKSAAVTLVNTDMMNIENIVPL
ncbi:hypothetical protein K4F52_009130 [Lecanicillium sp. MT-2017a]|nr:hypothetical protein K4F52_009130 [Lecanicillium sp. MT-2017a]